MVAHVELVNEGWRTDGLFHRFLVLLQLLLQPALTVGVFADLSAIKLSKTFIQRFVQFFLMFVLLHAVQLPLEFMDILHILLKVTGSEVILLPDFGERVHSVLL